MGSSRSVLLLVILVSLLGSCSKKDSGANNQAEKPKDKEVAELEMDQVDLQGYENGLISWRLKAPQAQAFTTLNFMRANDMKMTFYEGGEESTFVDADQGFIKTDQGSKKTPSQKFNFAKGKDFEPGDMYLEGNVVVRSTEGVTMETDWLWFHKTQDLITSTAPVTVKRPDSVTTGVGMEASSDLSEVEIFNQTVIIRDDE